MNDCRLLIVDDEIDFREKLEKRFRRRGYDIESAENCDKALQILENKKFDVIIMDISMPGGIDGMECTKRVKKKWPKTEVIILTGHASVATGIAGMQTGAFDYLMKPVEFDILVEKIHLAYEKASMNFAGR